jgi:hypothetical protein
MFSNQVHIMNVAYHTTSSITLTEVFHYLLSSVEAFFQTILENGLEKGLKVNTIGNSGFNLSNIISQAIILVSTADMGGMFWFVVSVYPIALKMAHPSGK